MDPWAGTSKRPERGESTSSRRAPSFDSTDIRTMSIREDRGWREAETMHRHGLWWACDLLRRPSCVRKCKPFGASGGRKSEDDMQRVSPSSGVLSTAFLAERPVHAVWRGRGFMSVYIRRDFSSRSNSTAPVVPICSDVGGRVSWRIL